MLSRAAILETSLITINAGRTTPLAEPRFDAPLPFGFAGGHGARVLRSFGLFQWISGLSLEKIKSDGDKTLLYSLIDC
jgi:hypothetical protein